MPRRQISFRACRAVLGSAAHSSHSDYFSDSASPGNPFRYFNSSPVVIRLAVMMYVRYLLSLRQVEDLLFERGIADGEFHEAEPSVQGRDRRLAQQEL